ncbi:MAG: acyl-CoA dehydrogenase family protein [Dehalococcoidia bacterium]|nr:acyl-CoA dehydrogenase family protein [Dehalococcoidia bacterium]
MDFELSEEHKAIQRLARDFAQKEIAPVVDADEKAHRFQRELVSRMGELGFLGCPIPEEYGGSGTGFLSHALVAEEIARVSGSLRAPFNMQTMGPSLTLLHFGTEEQKKKYIPKLVRAEILGALAITEPDAGSDVGAITATAIPDGDHFILNGTKTWITYAPVADVAVVIAYSDPNVRYKGISALLVDLHTPGITRREIADKMGWHACPTGELIFEDCRVPRSSLIGHLGQGFQIIMSDLNNTRLSATAGAIGVCQGLIDESLKYANQRVQFGQPIGQFQMVQDMIAVMIVETEASRLLAYRCAAQKDKGNTGNTLETSMAKYYSCETASRVADLALKIFSAYGYSGEYPVERYFRDAKLYQLLEGTSNIHKMIIAGDALGYRKANR